MTGNDDASLLPLKLMMENFFEFKKEGLESDEMEILLVMKSGYVKQCKTKIFLFTTYENEGFGFDVIITAYDCQEPFLNKQFTPCIQYD